MNYFWLGQETFKAGLVCNNYYFRKCPYKQGHYFDCLRKVMCYLLLAPKNVDVVRVFRVHYHQDFVVYSLRVLSFLNAVKFENGIGVRLVNLDETSRHVFAYRRSTRP